MTAYAHTFETRTDGPHQSWFEAVLSGGPSVLSQALVDDAFRLREVVLPATEPASLFDAEHYSAQDFVDLLGGLHEVTSALHALEVRTVVALSDAVRAEQRAQALTNAGHEPDAVDWAQVDERAARTAQREISMITRRSPVGAGRTQSSCTRLVRSMPGMLSALGHGLVSAAVAHATARATGPLEPAQREHVDRVLTQRLPDLDGAGPGRFADAVAVIINELDPRGVDGRHQRARADRHVVIRRGQHGMATLSAFMPTIDATAVRRRLHLEAERLRAGGDRRGHAAIMTDLLTDTLTGRSDGMDPVQLDIGIMITDRALFAPASGDLAHLEGYGPVPAEAVRIELDRALREPGPDDSDAYGPDGPALRAEFRRLFTHPTSGELIAVESRSRAFTPALARFLRLRDTTCRGPFCDSPIRQFDHIVPHAGGGPTSAENGQGACVLCNQKEQHLRRVSRDLNHAGHRVVWESRYGTTRATTATRLRGEPAAHDPP